MRIVVIAVAAALALSGCGIDKAGESGRQLDVIGDVEISTTFCTSGDGDALSRACAPFSSAHRGQLLVAYRLPDGASIPDELTDDGGLRHFTWSESYTAYMRDTYPEDGMYWAAYVSDPYSNSAGQQFAFTLSPEITLPNAGRPFAGPLRYQVVGGYRTFGEASDDGSAPVDCDADSTFCASAGVGDDSLQPTRDLAVLPGGAPPVVEAGGHVAVPFDLRFAGSGGEGVAFSLAASDGTVSQQTLQPASDSDSTVTVDVAVPADTEPGDYEISLTATALGEDDTVIRKVRGARLHVGGRQTRTGTMAYRVVAPSPDPPAEPPVQPAVDPPAVDPPAMDPPTTTPGPVPIPQPVPVHTPRPVRARLALSLTALPRRAYSGTNVAYRVEVRNVSRETALRTRTCAQLPRVVQLVRASAGVRFDGSRLCFARPRLAGGTGAAARLVAHVDVDARPGMTHARATATAANADPARARARMRVLRRPCRPEHVPVTG